MHKLTKAENELKKFRVQTRRLEHELLFTKKMNTSTRKHGGGKFNVTNALKQLVLPRKAQQELGVEYETLGDWYDIDAKSTPELALELLRKQIKKYMNESISHIPEFTQAIEGVLVASRTIANRAKAKRSRSSTGYCLLCHRIVHIPTDKYLEHTSSSQKHHRFCTLHQFNLAERNKAKNQYKEAVLKNNIYEKPHNIEKYIDLTRESILIVREEVYVDDRIMQLHQELSDKSHLLATKFWPEYANCVLRLFESFKRAKKVFTLPCCTAIKSKKEWLERLAIDTFGDDSLLKLLPEHPTIIFDYFYSVEQYYVFRANKLSKEQKLTELEHMLSVEPKLSLRKIQNKFKEEFWVEVSVETIRQYKKLIE